MSISPEKKGGKVFRLGGFGFGVGIPTELLSHLAILLLPILHTSLRNCTLSRSAFFILVPISIFSPYLHYIQACFPAFFSHNIQFLSLVCVIYVFTLLWLLVSEIISEVAKLCTTNKNVVCVYICDKSIKNLQFIKQVCLWE